MNWDQVYQGDNLEYLQKLIDADMTFNLILTDPPDNIGKDFGNDTDKQNIDDYFEGLQQRFKLFRKLLSPQGSLILFCTHIYIGKIQLMLQEELCQRRMMIWRYENGMSRQVKEPVTEYEPFWWFSKSNDGWTYNLDDVRVPYKSDRVKNPVYKRNKKGEKVAWLPNPKGRKRGDIWEYPTLAGKLFEDERTAHPTQKPESFITDLIKAFCPKGPQGRYDGRVLDPYLGSGTTAVCCEKLNKDGGKIKWVGIEKQAEWVEVANQRIKDEQDRRVEPDIFG